jgi:malonyl CoA-acyl carrier protein transacylase
MIKYETLNDILYDYRNEEEKGITFFHTHRETSYLTYGNLYRKAMERLYTLLDRGLESGDELVLLVEDLEHFVVSFWAGVMGGLTVIPMAVRATDEQVHHLLATWKQLKNPYILTDLTDIVTNISTDMPVNSGAVGTNSDNEEARKVLAGLEKLARRSLGESTALTIREHTIYLAELGTPPVAVTVDIRHGESQPPNRKKQEIAFIQYSSGSTGKPKGVVLKHENILTNIRAILEGLELCQSDRSMSWMPLTHDMGLLGFHLVPLAACAPQYLMPVSQFVRRPLLWMQRASDLNVSILGSPDFGLQLFLSVFKPEREYSWDLSNVRLIFNGAEPIQQAVCRRFSESLKKYKLRDNVIFPVYGLAEASLAVTFPRLNQPLETVLVNRHKLFVGEPVDVMPEDNEDSVRLMKVGSPVAGCRLKIVDADGKELPEYREGRIMIRGGNVTAGFYRDRERTRIAIDSEGWLFTGDLGFLSDGQLVVTGRETDSMVINGRNYYFHDLERIAEEVDGIRTNKLVVCGINGFTRDGNHLRNKNRKTGLYAFVVYRRSPDQFVPLARKIINHLYKRTGLSLKHVIPVERLPFTTSGKRMRYRLVRRLQSGKFDEIIRECQMLRKQKQEPVLGEATGSGEPESSPQDTAVHTPTALTEAILLPVFRRIIDACDIEPIEPGDNLAEYGVDSIKLHQLHQELDQMYPGVLGIVDFYENPTVSGIADLITRRCRLTANGGQQPSTAGTTVLSATKKERKVKKLALLFPGQGSQHVGMGQELCQYFPVANRTFEEAGDILKMDLKSLCFNGAPDELTRTDNAQPALLALSVAKFRVYRQEWDIVPTLGAGHSLGEYSALTCANAIDFGDALRLVRLRGQLMQEADRDADGGMMAVSGLEFSVVEEECMTFTDPGHQVVPANYNAQSQVVISGHRAALEEIAKRLSARGGRVVPLKVGAAFHSPLMKPSALRFGDALSATRFRLPEWPVISNIDARPYKDKESIPVLLEKQMTHPVRWQAIMEYINSRDIDIAIEMGPKRVLKNLMKKSVPGIKVYSTNSRDDLQELYEVEPDDFIEKRPNLVERCLAEAVCARNRNFNPETYQSEVVEPYGMLKNMSYLLAEEKNEPTTQKMKDALTHLQTIFNGKNTPVVERIKRLNRIFQESGGAAQQLLRDEHIIRPPEPKEPELPKPENMELAPALSMRKHDSNAIEDIAVIGISLRTAGAENTGEFWTNLMEKKDCIHEIPHQRQKDTDDYLPHLFRVKLDAAARKNKKRYLSAGYIKDIDLFDYRFFKLSPKEAGLMDPAQRLFLETAYEVLEDAGYAGENRNKYETGVYVGYSDDAKLTYFQMVSQLDPSSIPVAIAGNLSSIVPSRISYHMDLKGPAILVDTACSSSLTAVHLACQAIRSGDCEQAVAGGVRLNLFPIAHTAKVGIESSDGRTKTFDDDSDGTGTGEGAAAVLLKPLKTALADGDHIYAVIKGSAVNQDGQSMGITAPSAEAQANVLEKAWKNAGINPETISYIEAHGTGTRVGDPIEVRALTDAFSRFTHRKQFCAVGSVKTNIGHSFEAAGIFGLIKAVLSLKHRTLPGILHFNRPNRNIDFEDSPVYINNESMKWKTDGEPLRCGVTAFGFSGTNCHVVLEEAPGAGSKQELHETRSQSEHYYLLTLSARTKDSLGRMVKGYRDYFKETAADAVDICFTANTGRPHYNHRLALMAMNRNGLATKLERLARLEIEQIQDKYPDVFYGEHKTEASVKGQSADPCQHGETANRKLEEFCRSGRKSGLHLREAAQMYVAGAALDWDMFYKDVRARRVPLPLYPFDRKRCWLEIPPYQEETVSPLQGKLFFDMEWIPDELENAVSTTSGETGTDDGRMILVIKDDTGVGEQAARELRREGREVVEVDIGTKDGGFLQSGPFGYLLEGTEDSYEQLLTALKGKTVGRVLFFAPLDTKKHVTGLRTLNRCQKRGVYNLFHLTKMLLKHLPTETVECVVVADYVNTVTGKEKTIKPENAPLFGLANAIDRECENITAWCIDIDDSLEFPALFKELKADKQYRIAAYRDGKRYTERFIAIEEDKLPDEPVEIKNTGVYLVTGGTGGIGLEIGKHLAAKKKGVNIALVNRTPMPPREKWDAILYEEEDKRTCKKIEAIYQMEGKGAEVSVFSADTSNLRQMKQVIQSLKENYGHITGVIHGAGVEGEGLLARKSEKKFTNVLKPKITGTWILEQLTEKEPLDFMVLFSTVATFLMNPGQTDYTAANAYLDSFSEWRNRRGKKTAALNWVTWKETGMAVNFNANFDIIFKAITTAQALDAFEQILQKRAPRILIGQLNIGSKLINLLKNAQFRLSQSVRSIIDSPDNPLKPHSSEEKQKKIRKVNLTGRDNESYSNSELLVARIWGEVLGFDELRVDDNFYELGGDSILATQVVNRLNTENNLKISLIEIFNYETIKELGEYVESLS